MTQTVDYQTDTSDMLIPHGLFRTCLGSAGTIITKVGSGDVEQIAVVSSYLDNVLRFLDAHHEGEDAVVWPRLSERCPEAAELLARMQAEHDAIHELRGKAESRRGAWAQSGDPDDGRGLADALQSLAAELEVHFGEEEAEILPLASRHMSPEEWGQMPGHAMSHYTGDKLWLLLGLVFEQMTPEQYAAVTPHMPPPVMEMWSANGKSQFDGFIAQVRG